MDRQQLAYLLFILMALAIALAATFRWYHSRAQADRRQRLKESARDLLVAERMKAPPE